MSYSTGLSRFLIAVKRCEYRHKIPVTSDKNHRITKWIRLERTTEGPASLLENGHPRAQGTGMCSDSA